jgi:hypothetical protein
MTAMTAVTKPKTVAAKPARRTQTDSLTWRA